MRYLARISALALIGTLALVSGCSTIPGTSEVTPDSSFRFSGASSGAESEPFFLPGGDYYVNWAVVDAGGVPETEFVIYLCRYEGTDSLCFNVVDNFNTRSAKHGTELIEAPFGGYYHIRVVGIFDRVNVEIEPV
ncbi:MAG: hypothetical protein GXY82_01965 [Methanospirillum sp.]|nr:hypothetical protein [Methanospirillum sp.]